jgi:hypothetical protein
MSHAAPNKILNFQDKMPLTHDFFSVCSHVGADRYSITKQNIKSFRSEELMIAAKV